jgi:hypothetical protein
LREESGNDKREGGIECSLVASISRKREKVGDIWGRSIGMRTPGIQWASCPLVNGNSIKLQANQAHLLVES